MTRQLHIDCFSGISGDMALAALLDLGVPEEVVQNAVGSLGLDGQLVVLKVRKNGFAATRIEVQTPPQHSHRHLSHIVKIIDQGQMTDGARTLAKRMFQRLGEAEAASHGIPIEKVHFHEVGAVDSIFDFVGVAAALDWLKPERVSCRRVPTGQGFVDCDHGRLPIPAPAVARLLTGVPLAASSLEAELTTPTGAAIVACLADEFLDAPSFSIEKIGVGAGTRDFKEQPNLLRLILGTAATPAATDAIWQVETNLDDTGGEIIGYCSERLFEAGAVDVYTVPIHMKKNRPGVILAALCPGDALHAVERVLFRETGTFGVRRHLVQRAKLVRKPHVVETRWGSVKGKIGTGPDTALFTPEYEDCARVARERGVPLRAVYDEAVRRFDEGSA